MGDKMDTIKIDDNLYQDNKEKEQPEIIIRETDTISEELNNEFVEKVRRITIKGQVDGN